MTSDHVVISLENCASNVAKELQARGNTVRAEAAVASEFLARHGPEKRHIAPRPRWIKWDGERRILEFPGSVFARIRKLVLEAVRLRSAGLPPWHASPATLLAPGWNHGGGLR
jgi:hypothetical protein